MRRYRRIGKVIPFRRPEPELDPVHVPDHLRTERITEWYRIMSAILYDRLVEIDEDDTVTIMAELQAQAIVVGGVARRLRDTLPGDNEWVDPMADWYADFLERTQRL